MADCLFCHGEQQPCICQWTDCFAGNNRLAISRPLRRPSNRRVKRAQGETWNPAKRYLFWGGVCARESMALFIVGLGLWLQSFKWVYVMFEHRLRTLV